MECFILGTRPPWVALPHEHARNAHAPGTADKSVAGHVGAPPDEPWPIESATRLVRPRRARELAAAAPTAHRRHREPQVEQSGRPRVPRPKPTGNAVWA